MKKTVLAALISCALIGACSQPSEQAQTNSANTTTTSAESASTSQLSATAYGEQFVQELWQMYPQYALYVGFYDYDDQLPINDEARRSAELTWLKQQQQQLATLLATELTDAEQTDLSLLANFVERAIWQIEQFKDWQWDPSGYNVAGGFAQILNGDYKPEVERLRTISKRLANVPAYYQAAKANIKNPAVPQTRLAIQQNQGVSSVLGDELLTKVMASELTDDEKVAFEAALTNAQQAVDSYIEFLQELVPEQQGADPVHRLGEAVYEQKFAYDIQSQLTAKQLYQRALQDQQTIHSKMAELTEQLWPKYFAEQPMPEDTMAATSQMLDQLSLTHADPAQFKDAVEEQIPTLIAFIKEHDLLTLDDDKPLVIRHTPEYMRGYAVASIQAPGPYDAQANTYYNVMPLDGMPTEQAESFLREYNQYLMQVLNIHEAIPGHYTQLVYANKSPSLIKSIMHNGAMIEGWAVFAERMMLEAGYGDFEPELWLMYYKWNLRVVTNTLLDYSIHVLGMEQEQAMDLMVNQAFQQQAEAEGKWRRATLSQVQLTSYYAGFSDIMVLREKAKQRWGDDYSIKRFNETFLGYGNAPVRVIADLMLAK
ncbi:DUF885 domain-containing protein [Neiella marina]|uniref:DUF885 domain-containing protein n=1 Tax=Neiella holothuriorum TaxID=2870530 RepID=A0ABS7EFK7_9GAMM|nr:DUF885 domain-containing protein [Neiella holothuriorum]MBW8191116.1 DUF885 domain-containing protein [Neiella holothuriorum]